MGDDRELKQFLLPNGNGHRKIDKVIRFRYFDSFLVTKVDKVWHLNIVRGYLGNNDYESVLIHEPKYIISLYFRSTRTNNCEFPFWGVCTLYSYCEAVKQ